MLGHSSTPFRFSTVSIKFLSKYKLPNFIKAESPSTFLIRFPERFKVDNSTHESKFSMVSIKLLFRYLK